MRFKFKWLIIKKLSLCGHGGIGRRARFRFWWVSRAGSSPVARTRLSLDAIRVPGSAFSFAFSLALAAGSDLVTSTGGELHSQTASFTFVGFAVFLARVSRWHLFSTTLVELH